MTESKPKVDKTNVASCVLALRTKKYWRAASAWNGRSAKQMSPMQQAKLLNECLRGEQANQKLSSRGAEMIHKLIMYRSKPKRGLPKVRDSKVLELKKRETNV